MTRYNTENLPGKREQRVFIGGQYDFMPTLRELAQYVREISSPEKELIPIIAVDCDMAEEETMDRDLEILGRCKYAIFDLSDLGAQLVEMQEARQKKIDSLIVYPVRERRNEPARGRRTVISFGLPHFGYRTFYELKGIVWRFLTDAPTGGKKDYTPRIIYDPILSRETRRIRVLLATGKKEKAEEILNDLVGKDAYKRAIELWLQLAIVGHYRNNNGLTNNALSKATEIARGNPAAEAELAYCRGIIAWLKKELPNAQKHLENANNIKSGVGRILELLGYVYWRLGDRKAAIKKTEEALQDESIPDPIITISVLNNLAYFYCEEAKETYEINLIYEAYELTADLPEYHRVFRRRDAAWLDTRGLVATRMASHLADQPHEKDKANDALTIALQVLEDALKLAPDNTDIKDHWQEALDLKKRLTGGT